MNTRILVGDIGGTNVRLALFNTANSELSDVRTYSVSEYSSLSLILKSYLEVFGAGINSACLAIACPITGDKIEMTNTPWSFSISETKEELGLEEFFVINDFTAISLSVPQLSAKDVIQVGGTKNEIWSPIAVYGPGTGLGVAQVLKAEDKWLSLPGEGGHIDLATRSKWEDALLSYLRDQFGRVSVERVLSGPGLVNLYNAIMHESGEEPDNLLPEQITANALSGSNAHCVKTLNLFCEMLGRFGGELALICGSRAGVYLAGGIPPRIIDFLINSNFRRCFEDKGRLSAFVKDIPVYLVTHDFPGLLGAGTYYTNNTKHQ
ncbi:glucokinase [Vibrio albus]|uniref:Glucokinase n=1 Tax=Vibrio albus TaxID=2200953 RepID=A0A2U3B9N8_9VIBR|nr:glucokinase [Vibrio albus]PWI33434.1 glucokinase [Vibrio albus]